MSQYESNTTIPVICKKINAANQILLTTHAKPDADALGSCLAIHRALAPRGKSCDIYLAGPVEPNLLPIAGETPFRLLENEMPGDDYDIAIVSDTGTWTQLELLSPWLKKHHEHCIVIDHHAHGDNDVAAMRYVDPDAVSTTALLIPLLDELEFELTGEAGGVAEALFAGIATDSGWFRYPNAGAEALQLGGRLLKCGVNKTRLYQILEETYSPQRLALEARALSSLEYVADGFVAIQYLRPEDFLATGGSFEDITALVNTPLTVSSVRISILLSQMKPGITKISLRSKPPISSDETLESVDVNQLAQDLGGGGHVHAAGARLQLDIDAARKAVISALESSLSSAHRS